MISVALCTYNGEKYIRQQLDSILNQTMPVDEIVVHDDCSIDSTNSILEDYSKRFPQIKYTRNSYNHGFVKNFEEALNECQGDFIFFSDQDDLWMKDKVEISVQYLIESGMYGVFSDGLLIDHNNCNTGETLFSKLQLPLLIKEGLLDKFDFEILCLNGNYVTGATLAIVKEAKQLVLPFPFKYVYHDMWIALRLSSIRKLGRIDQPLISYRIHNDQECGLEGVPKNKESLLKCFHGYGNLNFLIHERRFSVYSIYYCKLKKAARKRIFSVYNELYWKNVKKKCSIKAIMSFFLTEVIVFVKTKTGIRA